MPALATLADVRTAIAGDGDVENAKFFDCVAMLGSEREGSWAAPVMTDQKKLLVA